MNRQEFQAFIKDKLIFLDGATGSNLQKKGMPAGVCPEQWILEHRDIMMELQRNFVSAGSNIVYAPTFTANRIKLKEYGLEEQIGQMNRDLVALSREAVGGKAYVAGRDKIPLQLHHNIPMLQNPLLRTDTRWHSLLLQIGAGGSIQKYEFILY